MKYLSKKQAMQWLNQHASYGETNMNFNRKIMKTLDNTCRLMPAKHTLFGVRYSLIQLERYAKDVNPR